MSIIGNNERAEDAGETADARSEEDTETTMSLETADEPRGTDAPSGAEDGDQPPADHDGTGLAESPDPGIPLDIVFEILKNERRRLVLEYLTEVDGTVTLGELAEHIAAIENDISVQELGAQQRKRVYIGLYQCHLPKMDDAGVVEFNRDRGLVDLGADAEVFLEYLSHEPAPEPVELQYYLGIALAGGSLFAATRAMGMGMLSDAAVVSMILCVGGLAVYHQRSIDSDASA